MRITRIYHDSSVTIGTTLTLPASPSNHLIRVLRCKTGAAVIIFNGEGGEFTGTLLNEDPKATQVKITGFIDANRESPLRITLIQGISRSEHLETTIQKATELGVTEIIPVICERSVNIKKERAVRKHARWQQIIVNACEQCGRNIPPVLHEITGINQAISEPHAGRKLVLDPAATDRINNIEFNGSSLYILSGPEGGLSDHEISASSALGYSRINIGPRILRTETAGAALISALQTLWGDMG